MSRTPWRTRLLFNTWRAPFPYLLHSWQLTCEQGYITSGRAWQLCRWLAQWWRLELATPSDHPPGDHP